MVIKGRQRVRTKLQPLALLLNDPALLSSIATSSQKDFLSLYFGFL